MSRMFYYLRLRTCGSQNPAESSTRQCSLCVPSPGCFSLYQHGQSTLIMARKEKIGGVYHSCTMLNFQLCILEHMCGALTLAKKYKTPVGLQSSVLTLALPSAKDQWRQHASAIRLLFDGDSSTSGPSFRYNNNSDCPISSQSEH